LDHEGDKHPPGRAEDVFIGQSCKDLLKKPSKEEAREFSVESWFHEKTMGIHKAWRWVENQEDVKRLIGSYNREKLDSRTPQDQLGKSHEVRT